MVYLDILKIWSVKLSWLGWFRIKQTPVPIPAESYCVDPFEMTYFRHQQWHKVIWRKFARYTNFSFRFQTPFLYDLGGSFHPTLSPREVSWQTHWSRYQGGWESWKMHIPKLQEVGSLPYLDSQSLITSILLAGSGWCNWFNLSHSEVMPTSPLLTLLGRFQLLQIWSGWMTELMAAVAPKTTGGRSLHMDDMKHIDR